MRIVLALAWGLSITAGALWLRFARPEADMPLLAALGASEPFHVFAHTMGYGGLAWLFSRRLPLVWVVPAVLALGGVQELAQVVGVRPFGGGEVFDLVVDGVAAGVVVLAVRARRGRAGAVKPAAPGPAAPAGRGA